MFNSKNNYGANMKKLKSTLTVPGSGNPGKGGWAAVLVYNGTEKEISGGSQETTNNRMELTAVIEALKKLKEPCEVTLTTDSKYVCDAVTKGWVYSWQKHGWKKLTKSLRLMLTFGNVFCRFLKSTA